MRVRCEMMFRVGDRVMLKVEVGRRLKWRLGEVTNIYPGSRYPYRVLVVRDGPPRRNDAYRCLAGNLRPVNDFA